AALAGDVLPVHAQHDVLVLRHVRPRARGDPGRPRRRHVDPRLPRVAGRLRGPAARLLRGAVGGADGARHHADRVPVPLRGEEGDLLMARTLAQPATLAAAQERPRRRDWHAFTAHVILIASVALLAFPLYYAFVISTQTLSQVTTTPPKPWPSTALLANYAEAWHRAQMGRMLVNSAIVALGLAIGTLVIPLSKANMAALFVILFVYGWNDYLWPLMITNTPEMRTAVIGIETLVPRTSQLPEWNVAMAVAMMVLAPPVAVIVAMQRWFVKIGRAHV